MSDRQKGLIDAFKTTIPNADIRYCCRHIWTNFKGKFPGVVYKEHFWKAARSSTVHHFNIHMATIKELNEDAFKYLSEIPAQHWSRHAFTSARKSGMLLNNCCESFNNVLRKARSKPILQLMEWIRRYVIQRCCAKREGLKIFEGVIMPSVVKMVHMGLKEASAMRINQAYLNEFEVDHEDDTYVVNLENRTCVCYKWTLMGIPC
ncbi:uncharacterized protein LOC110722143 isoform X1 [Chenopodium quinoa]|uniref:uncharacterized protein LOC110722143 isoform X1 n=1 Tax=Chenopodium quinoa TaxID=63459 RepID=UPI000B77CFA1|nr:uncharacterized protein LOC110722143 isoform X1 [Chenopodium quinoa]XP_021757093.1 uncharacterized protein LOC110722143 isoform X1 [Chenopodium quinoa]